MTPAQVRAEFWRRHRGVLGVSKRRPLDHETREAWSDYLRALIRDGVIEEETAWDCGGPEDHDE